MSEYRQANQSLVLLAQRDLSDFWGSLNLLGDPTRIRDLLLEFFPELLATYGDAAALLGADWYDMLRSAPPSAARFRAALASPVKTDQAIGSARWALGPLFLDEPDPVGALDRLMGATQRLVLAPGRDGVFTAAHSDPVATGVARVPSGPTTCKFCVMLASRGAVYRSATSAGAVVGHGKDVSQNFNADGSQRVFGNRMAKGVKARGSQDLGRSFHDNCDCVPLVIRKFSDYPKGYADQLEEFRKLYREDAGIGRDIPTD